MDRSCRILLVFCMLMVLTSVPAHGCYDISECYQQCYAVYTMCRMNCSGSWCAMCPVAYRQCKEQCRITC
uniref:Uncharacterized protein n=1 Tax=Pinctada fucata TaxID=50426 RepID=A0A194AIX2_PINFU